MNKCPYSDILGVPKEGIHRIRIFDIAIMDVLLTFVLAWFVKCRLFPYTCIMFFVRYNTTQSILCTHYN